MPLIRRYSRHSGPGRILGALALIFSLLLLQSAVALDCIWFAFGNIQWARAARLTLAAGAALGAVDLLLRQLDRAGREYASPAQQLSRAGLILRWSALAALACSFASRHLSPRVTPIWAIACSALAFLVLAICEVRPFARPHNVVRPRPAPAGPPLASLRKKPPPA